MTPVFLYISLPTPDSNSPAISSRHRDEYLFSHTAVLYALSIGNRVTGVGWLSATATESLIAFAERVFAICFYKNIVFFYD